MAGVTERPTEADRAAQKARKERVAAERRKRKKARLAAKRKIERTRGLGLGGGATPLAAVKVASRFGFRCSTVWELVQSKRNKVYCNKMQERLGSNPSNSQGKLGSG